MSLFLGRLLAALVLSSLAAGAAHAGGLTVEELRIPMTAAGPPGLEAVLVAPTTPGHHPLALVSHGSPRNGADRDKMSARGLLPQLGEFARRGFVAIAVLRRSYGSSPGGWTDSFGSCADPDYLKGGRAGAEDLKAAIAALVRRSDVDPARILAVGVSAGGFATLALAADPPPGLVAAISFAGGRGSQAADNVCRDERLVEAVRTFGRTARVPMLWVYAKNDHFFDPPLARRLYGAFVHAGGHADFVTAPAFGEEGHFLFSDAGRPQWTPIVDAFLKRRGLMPAPADAGPQLDPPAQVTAQGRTDFAAYRDALPHKAFAVSPGGAYAWRTARRSTPEAIEEALSKCEAQAHAPCRLYAVDDGYAGKKLR